MGNKPVETISNLDSHNATPNLICSVPCVVYLLNLRSKYFPRPLECRPCLSTKQINKLIINTHLESITENNKYRKGNKFGIYLGSHVERH